MRRMDSEDISHVESSEVMVSRSNSNEGVKKYPFVHKTMLDLANILIEPVKLIFDKVNDF